MRGSAAGALHRDVKRRSFVKGGARSRQSVRPWSTARSGAGTALKTGAEAQSILMSVLRTSAQQQRDSLDFLSRPLSGQRPRLRLAPI